MLPDLETGIGGPSTRAAIFYSPRVDDGAVADIQFQSTLIFYNAGGISPVGIERLDPLGDELELEFSGLGKQTVFELGLGAGESFSTQTPRLDLVQVGYAQVISASGLAAITLRQNDDPILSFPEEVPILTAFPVLPASRLSQGSP